MTWYHIFVSHFYLFLLFFFLFLSDLFDDADGLCWFRYAKHPLHQAAIVEHIKPNLAAGGRVAVQYEI